MSTCKLTDTQLVLLSAASQRDDGLIAPPAHLKGGALNSVLSKLATLGFVEDVSVGRGDFSWRTDDASGRPIGLKVTRAGLQAIGLELDESEPHLSASAEARRIGPSEADAVGPPPTKRPRDGSKRELVVGLLSGEEGASLEDLVQATGRLPHTTRAALTGLRQRGYELERAKNADGRSVYRITEAPDQGDSPAAAEV